MVEEGTESDGTQLKSQVVEGPFRPKKSLFRSRFQVLLLFSVIFLIIYYSLPSNNLTWWESFPLHVHYSRLVNRTRWIPPPPASHKKIFDKFNQINGAIKTTLNGGDGDATAVVQYHSAYPRNYRFIMDNPEPCKAKTPFLVLMVPVAPGNMAARDAIRKTWGNETLVQGELVQTLFMLGLPGGEGAQQLQEKVKEENLLHHDLIQSDFMDTYINLTIKTMVIMDWLATRCPKASFVMKIDSDMFLNVQNLVKLLLDPNTPKQNYMTGLVWWHSPVLRNPFNKFYMPREVIAEPEYPPYPLGMGYVMSLDLPGKILGISNQIRPIYIEDAYLGMCLKHLGISPTNPPDESMFIVNPSFALSRCSLSKVIAVTTTGVPQMMNYWEKNLEPGAPC
ncbi:beta-1,3-galactosyltransferase 1-like [Polymixia lowei]